jgi:hypothetical protein
MSLSISQNLKDGGKILHMRTKRKLRIKRLNAKALLLSTEGEFLHRVIFLDACGGIRESNLPLASLSRKTPPTTKGHSLSFGFKLALANV